MKANSQRRLRQIHLWLGLFFAPSILFFALSGSLQALGFQDRSAGYAPPAWINLVANVHKHGALQHPSGARPTPPRDANIERSAPQSGRGPALPNLFSLFAFLLGLLLATATALGIWIGLLNRRDRRLTLLLLGAGILVPIGLLVA